MFESVKDAPAVPAIARASVPREAEEPGPGAPLRPIEQLEEEIAELAAHIWAATARFLILVAEFDHREGWGQVGMRSCAHWLSWKCGLSLGAAREHVRTARELAKLPQVAEAFERGELSYSKVRAITRIGSEETEETLLDWALHSTAAQLERVVQGVRRARRLQDPGRMRTRRTVRHWYDDDGMFVMRARLSPEEGEIVLKALEAASAVIERNRATQPENVPAGTSPDGPAENVPAGTFSGLDEEPVDPFDLDATPLVERKDADALGLMAETFLSATPTPLSGPERTALLINVNLESLFKETDECETGRGTALHPETARRLACDSSVIRALRDSAGRALSIGRRSRVVPRPMRRLLMRRDNGICQFPGCASTYGLDAHHVWHWIRGGATCLENLIILCRRHHHMVHEGGYWITRAGDRFVFHRPDGRVLDRNPSTASHGPALQVQHRDRGIAIDSETCESRWDGSRPDYDLSVSLFLQQADGAS